MRKYARLSAAHLTDYVDRVASFRLVGSGNVATIQPCAGNEEGVAASHPFFCLARPAGFEPTTPWFVGDPRHIVMY